MINYFDKVAISKYINNVEYKPYTGVGSRSTPFNILEILKDVGYQLAKLGYTLRSGHAPGADDYFERGCDLANGSKEIYLPWKGFEGSNSNLIVSKREAFEIGEKFHKGWHTLSYGSKKLIARDSHQVLGENLCSLSEFVLCWTKNGTGEGGTGQAIRIGTAYNIPILDLGLFKNEMQVKKALSEFLYNNTGYYIIL